MWSRKFWFSLVGLQKRSFGLCMLMVFLKMVQEKTTTFLVTSSSERRKALRSFSKPIDFSKASIWSHQLNDVTPTFKPSSYLFMMADFLQRFSEFIDSKTKIVPLAWRLMSTFSFTRSSPQQDKLSWKQYPRKHRWKYEASVEKKNAIGKSASTREAYPYHTRAVKMEAKFGLTKYLRKWGRTVFYFEIQGPSFIKTVFHKDGLSYFRWNMLITCFNERIHFVFCSIYIVTWNLEEDEKCSPLNTIRLLYAETQTCATLRYCNRPNKFAKRWSA